MPTLLPLLLLPLAQSPTVQALPGRDPAPPAPRRPNILGVTADDFGVDMVSAYGEAYSSPCTPTLDALAAEGLLFRNAWASPVCSPTRATLMTGRYGFRTGIGSVIQNEDGLATSETALPELLTGYATAAVGKWHLSGRLGDTHPNDSGFQHFSGSVGGAVGDYWSWPHTQDGVTTTSTQYLTTAEADDAITAIGALPEPWFLYLNFHAPHSPYHAPPAALCAASGCPGSNCSSPPANATDRQLARYMVETMDSELGRVLDFLELVDPEAFVIFLGDNGTARGVSRPPFLGSPGKGSVHETGINVPLIVAGPGVARGECQALVSSVDVFATVAELAGVPSGAEDSVSFASCLRTPALSPRGTVYSETFQPNHGALPFASHDRAIRDERYKLVRSTGAADAFYDLLADPTESVDLYPNLNAQEQAAYQALAAELLALGVG